MDSVYTVTLTGGGPWGIRIQGGKDFSTPLSISRVTAGGKGAQAGIKVGEQIVEINSQATVDLVHVAAQKLIKNTGLNLELTLNRSGAMETPRSSAPHTVASTSKHKTQYQPLVQPSSQTGMAASQYRGKSYQVQTKYEPKEIVNSTKPSEPVVTRAPEKPLIEPPLSPQAFPPAPVTSFPPPPEFLKSDPAPSFTKPPPVINRPSVFASKSDVDSFKSSFQPSKPQQTYNQVPKSPLTEKKERNQMVPNGLPSKNEYSQALVDEINNIKLSEERNQWFNVFLLFLLCISC